MSSTNTTSTSTSTSSSEMNAEIVRKYLLKYHLPLGLFIGVILGYLYSKPGEFLSDLDSGFYGMGISSLDIFLIFLISGLKLKTDDVKKALTSFGPLVYGVFSILLITPCVSFGLVRLDGELSVPEFAFGIAVFSLMPTTLSSGVILTRDANGTVPISLMLTVVTNLSAVRIELQGSACLQSLSLSLSSPHLTFFFFFFPGTHSTIHDITRVQ